MMDAIAVPVQMVTPKHGVGIVFSMLECLSFAHAINSEHTQHGFFLKAYFPCRSAEEVKQAKQKAEEINQTKQAQQKAEEEVKRAKRKNKHGFKVELQMGKKEVQHEKSMIEEGFQQQLAGDEELKHKNPKNATKCASDNGFRPSS